MNNRIHIIKGSIERYVPAYRLSEFVSEGWQRLGESSPKGDTEEEPPSDDVGGVTDTPKVKTKKGKK